MFTPSFSLRYEKFYRALAGLALTITSVTTLIAVTTLAFAIARHAPALALIGALLALLSIAGALLTRRHLRAATYWQQHHHLATHGHRPAPMPPCTVNYQTNPH